MTSALLHPWLDTPEALAAAHKAVAIPRTMLGRKAFIVGYDELAAEALVILTECALPPRDRMPTACAHCGGTLENVRKGAKFCAPSCKNKYAVYVQRKKSELIPAGPGGHIGSMWKWPEDKRTTYAIREIGYVLNNYLRTRQHDIETPATEIMANMNLVAVIEDTPRELIEEYLESKGIRVQGDETLEELGEAAVSARKAELS